MTRQGLDADFSPVAEALGNIQGVTGYIQTNQHISKAVRSLATASAQEIGTLIDEQVSMEGFKSNLSHVYEWDAFDPNGSGNMRENRLFRFNVTTSGGRNATVSFMFLQSRKPIPTPREYNEMGYNDLGEASLEKFEESGNDYVFTSQAISFEYGATVTVRSRSGDGWLAVPTRGFERPKFYKGSYILNLDEAAPNHAGAFTQKFYELSQTAPVDTMQAVERGIAKIVKKNTTKTTRPRKKPFSIAFRAAEKKGLDHTKRDLENMYESFVLNQ